MMNTIRRTIAASGVFGSDRRRSTPVFNPHAAGYAYIQNNGKGKPATVTGIVLILLLILVCFPVGIVAAIIYGCTRRAAPPQSTIILPGGRSHE